MRYLTNFVLAASLTSVGLAQSTLATDSPMGAFVQWDLQAPSYQTLATGIPASLLDPVAVRAERFENNQSVAQARTKASLRDLEGLPAVRIYEAGELSLGAAQRQRAVGTSAQPGSPSSSATPPQLAAHPHRPAGNSSPGANPPPFATRGS